MGKIIDMTGEKYGKLTVIKRDPKKSKNSLWICRCDCGNGVSVSRPNLIRGHTQSCGCLRKKIVYTKHQPIERKINEIGNIYGDLIVIEYAGKNNSTGNALWKCQCRCGNTTTVLGTNLRRGLTHSCGCNSSSIGEKTIKRLLENNNISYIGQKTFNSCRFKDTKALARFDFYVNNQYLIEFDGIQHFKFYDNKGWNIEDRYKKTKEHDTYKNQWCFQNNIPLIRIPYTRLNSLSIEDLQPETTTFLVKEVIK